MNNEVSVLFNKNLKSDHRVPTYLLTESGSNNQFDQISGVNNFCNWIMNLKIFNLTCKFYSIASFSRINTMNPNKCYFRHIQYETEDKIDISFLLKVENSVRQFNFSRNPTESLETLAVRISTNVQKAIKKANKKKGTAEQPNVEVTFSNAGDNPLPQETLCQDLFHLREPLKLQIYDQYYEVHFNSPWIVNINLPQSIMAGFPVHPEHMVTHFVTKEKTTFNWYKGVAINENGKEINDIHIKWEFIGTGPSYIPCPQDIGKKLKLACIPGSKCLPT